MAVSAFLKTYLSETPIHGFGFIGNASSKGAVCFWALIILVAAGLCVNDIITQVSFYKTVPTMVSIEVHRKAEFEPPVPVLCIEINHFYLKAPNKLSGNDLNGTYVPLLLQNTKNLTYLPLPPTYGIPFYYSDQLMPYDLFYYTYVMLGYMASFQILVSEHNYVTNYWDMFDMAQTPNFYKEQEGILVNQLFQTYKVLNVSFDKLSRLIGAILCGIYISESPFQFGSNVEIGSHTYLIQICSPEAITHLSLALVCLQIGNTSLWSTPNFDLQIGFVQSGAILDVSEISPNDVSNNFLWHLDFQGRPVYDSSDSLNVHKFRPPRWAVNTTYPVDYPGYMGTHETGMKHLSTYPEYFTDNYQINYGPETLSQLSISVRMSDYYKFYSKESKRCSSAKQRFNAVLEQRAEYFYRKCGCWPTQLYLSSNLSNSQATESCSQRFISVKPTPKDKLPLDNVPLSPIDPTPPWQLDKTMYENIHLADVPVIYTFQQHYMLFTNTDNMTAYPCWKECTGSNETLSLVEECEMITFSVTESAFRSAVLDKSFIRIEVRNESVKLKVLSVVEMGCM